MSLDDHDLFAPATPATPSTTTRRCGRHDWPDGICRRCGKVRDETVTRRNRNNRARGGRYEAAIAKKLGGRKTGPLGGRDDVMVGGMFAVQTKRAARFALTEARVYLADLRRTYPTRTPIVVHGLPGERGGVVIVSLEDWVALHGTDPAQGT